MFPVTGARPMSRLFFSARSLSPFLAIFLLAFWSEISVAQPGPVSFDAPALAIAREVVPAVPISSEEKMIEVVLPVSSQIQFVNRNDIREFRFDVGWNRMVYPLVGYGPRTQTFSNIDGTIAVEQRSSRDADLGINLSGTSTPAPFAGSAKAGFSTDAASSRRYAEIPQHEVLVASGTIERGTGAFFRFHPSNTETLEGGRDLIVAYRVPRTWRGGLLAVQCRASGERRVLGSWTEPVQSSRSFVVAIYLDGDDQARQISTEFVRRELTLQERFEQDHADRRGNELRRLFGPPSDRTELPEQWAELLVQSGSDDYFLRYEDRLESAMQADAAAFVDARQEMVKLSR